MRLRTIVGLLLVAIAVPGVTAVAQASPARLALARELIVVTQADSMMLRTIEVMVPLQRQTMPQVPAEFWDEFLRRARADLPLLVDSLAPPFARRFNEAELRAIIDFYKSPVGKKFVTAQAPLQQESMAFGQRWGARLGTAVGADLEKRGVKMQ